MLFVLPEYVKRIMQMLEVNGFQAYVVGGAVRDALLGSQPQDYDIATDALPEQVIALAKLAQEAGMDGVVASPQEAAGIRSACGPEFLIVTPGVRPAGASIDDQSRIATPVGAFKNGSSHIVVGRPITKAEDKIAAAQSIVAEIRGV